VDPVTYSASMNVQFLIPAFVAGGRKTSGRDAPISIHLPSPAMILPRCSWSFRSATLAGAAEPYQWDRAELAKLAAKPRGDPRDDRDGRGKTPGFAERGRA